MFGLDWDTQLEHLIASRYDDYENLIIFVLIMCIFDSSPFYSHMKLNLILD